MFVRQVYFAVSVCQIIYQVANANNRVRETNAFFPSLLPNFNSELYQEHSGLENVFTMSEKKYRTCSLIYFIIFSLERFYDLVGGWHFFPGKICMSHIAWNGG